MIGSSRLSLNPLAQMPFPFRQGWNGGKGALRAIACTLNTPTDSATADRENAVKIGRDVAPEA